MTQELMDTKSIQDRVTAICNDLYSKGTKPSVRLVLSMLPDVSSTSTVHKYFANWKKELEANSQSLYDKLGFSSEFTQSFMKEITRFGVEAEQRYKELALDANEQRDQVLEDLERSEERAHKQVAIVEQQDKEVKELQVELLAVKSKLEAELVKDKEAHEATVNELRKQLTEEAGANTTLLQQNETLRMEIAKAELKQEGNQKFVGEVKAQNTEYLEENKVLNKSLAELNAALASHTATITGNDKLVIQLETTNNKYLEENKVLNKSLAELNATLASHTATITGIDKLVIQLETTNNKLETSNKSLEKESTKVIVERDSLSKQVNDTSLKLSEATNVITDLKTTLAEQSKVISIFSANQGKV